MPSALHYTLTISNWRAHQFTVALHIPVHNDSSLTLTLPSWIPGSYMVRDFAKSIIRLSATLSTSRLENSSGENPDSVPVTKLDKQTWRVKTDGKACTVNYTVYANDLSIRSAFMNDEYAFINGTSAFLRVSGFEQAACELDIELDDSDPSTANWKAYTSMPIRSESTSARRWHFAEKNYDELIDHPIYVGIADTHSFDVDGITFTLLFSGNNNIDYPRIARDLTPICKHHLDLFGAPQPINNYLFMTLLADNGFGGLEHKHSTALLYPRFDLPQIGEGENKTDSYITFLSLCSHEFFHTWHVKRIKPEVMVKPDLSQETYTNQLWIYEGFTSFYDDVTLARAGVIEPQKYLDIVAQNVSRLLQNAGRFKQSAAESSFDAWTKFYKQDASATNNIVSYYTKGGIIALGLDLLLRKKSDNQVNLDSLMQLLWKHYGIDECGTPDDVIQSLCDTHFGIDVSDYLDRVVYGTDDVELAALVSDMGVNYKTRTRVSAEDKGGFSQRPSIKNQLGATLKPATFGLTVVQVFEGLAAMKAGILLNDVIIALDGHIVNAQKLQRLLDNAQTSTVDISLIRDGRLITLPIAVTEARQEMAYFEITDEEKLNKWLGK
ncbi:M61 family peptidase [Alteromonas sp. BL110]|uniref:M61 family metallopeptidase n=1 Tax=Alteromonas sp. BL110 TaxID=1714845 RepID=UPI000E486A4F|nr:PDZ domain-containing protein [Alteromonas sp. BL110]AXT40373.1 M61 family peptidase [Alteromonas sp. BL110]RKM79605.1 PDZ domain-containing protein [Alteromonas sp. BL110]